MLTAPEASYQYFLLISEASQQARVVLKREVIDEQRESEDIRLTCRRTFIGGSDARIIMGSDEAALLRLWREKRGEVEPQDLSGNLIVQLGVVTEPLNRQWFERQYRPCPY